MDDGADNLFGTTDDALIAGGDPARIARIASVIIKGQAEGTPAAMDHFGILAEQIGLLSIGGVVRTPSASTPALAIGTRGDFAARIDV